MSEILNRILAIPQAPDDAGDETIVSSPVLGFVYVSVLVSLLSCGERGADGLNWIPQIGVGC